MRTLPVVAISRTTVLLLSLFVSLTLVQAEFFGKVVGVINGDSIRVMHEGEGADSIARDRLP